MPDTGRRTNGHEAPEHGRLDEQFARDVRAGLTADLKHLDCRWFYDEVGSALFQEICGLPEYYIPAAEREVLTAHAGEIAAAMPAGTEVVELGSGDARKTRILLEALLARHRRVRYVPIDISKPALDSAAAALRSEYPGLDVVPVVAEYEAALARLFEAADRPKLVIWLGSSIGNLGRAEAAAFLGRIRRTLAPADRLLVGIDLRKDRGTLESAYDDAAGVTARFNRNLLVRVNRELGGRFDVDRFRHRAVWRDDVGRVEMHLVSERDATVAVERLGLEVRFAKDEAIHTENCHKYSPAEIDDLAKGAGLVRERQWFDGRAYFSVNVFAP